MPRVLMICYFYPPQITSGAVRSLAFSENLAKHGWEPIVLTVAKSKDPYTQSGGMIPGNVRIERSFEWSYARVLDVMHAVSCRLARVLGLDLRKNYFREFLAVPDTQIGWFSTLKAVSVSADCKVLYATCSPFSSALSAVIVKCVTGKPLVLDFRDAWTLNPHISFGRFHRAIIKQIERFVIAKSDYLILNTEGALRLYQKAYPEFAQKLLCIPNGYDALTPVLNRGDNGSCSGGKPFVIMHIGSFYGARSPRLLLEAIVELVAEQPDLNIEFVQVGGSFEEEKEFEHQLKITIYGMMPREQALEIMQSASLLYLKQGWEKGVKDYVAVAAKTFEYVATGLPILAEVPPGDNADILRRYSSSAAVVTEEKPEGARESLKSAILQAYANRDLQKSEILEDFVRDFSRDELTKRLALVLTKAAANR